jgi:uncharacterized damage-inducible protein DinB
MKLFAAVTILLLTGSVVSGQTKSPSGQPQGVIPQPNQTDSALTAETRRVFQSISMNILKAAREMPANAYDFKPSSDARTFGDLLAHIAKVQTTLCDNINNHRAKMETQPPSKDNTIKDFETSVTECEESFAELSAENINTLVEAPAGKITHLAALIYIISHASEEYGQLTIYLRLNHLEPPTSDEPKGGAAGKAKS